MKTLLAVLAGLAGFAFVAQEAAAQEKLKSA